MKQKSFRLTESIMYVTLSAETKVFFCVNLFKRGESFEGRKKSSDYPFLYGLQAEELFHDEEQERASRQNRNKKALPLLQQAHPPQGNQVRGDLCNASNYPLGCELWKKPRI